MKSLLLLMVMLFGCDIVHQHDDHGSFDGINAVITPNGKSLPWKMENGVKVFHLIAEQVKQEFAPGLVVNAWGYNGSTPGPTIEAVEGDRVKIYVTNRLKESTTVHWHGMLVPNSQDGVAGLNQPAIAPGETFAYEFTLKQYGTYMYHPHFDEMTQIGMGMMGFFVIHPKDADVEPVDRDFAIFLHEWHIPTGSATPNPMEMTDFNYSTFNGRVFPGTAPLVVKKGERVRIRFANLSMDNHPIHLHGYAFNVVAEGGFRLPKSAQYLGTTIDVTVGNTNEIEFVADEVGDWGLHCHKTHHLMNGMEHNLPNLLNVDQSKIAERIQKIFPDYMPMGEAGMGEMLAMDHDMTMPPNFLSHGSPGPFGKIDMGGMFTIVKVRDDIDDYSDPDWFGKPTAETEKNAPPAHNGHAHQHL